MPTYLELQAEPWWGAETVPPALATLRTRLLAFYNLSGSAIGIKGDNNHLRGYHRSRAWILNSRYCTNRTYSVSRTTGDRSGGDSDWLAAMDINPGQTALLAMCQRLDTAVRAGRLEKITEWYGNTDGDSRVDGYDNIANAVASSDSSHLWHLHISFDRGRVDEDHTDVYAVLTGDDDMPTVREVWDSSEADLIQRYDADGRPILEDNPKMRAGYALGWATRGVYMNLAQVAQAQVKLDAVLAAVKGDDTDTILAAIAAQGEQTRTALAGLAPALTEAIRAELDVEIDEAALGTAVARALAQLLSA